MACHKSDYFMLAAFRREKFRAGMCQFSLLVFDGWNKIKSRFCCINFRTVYLLAHVCRYATKEMRKGWCSDWW